MTTSLDTAHQVDMANLALKVKDVDLAGALSVAGNLAVTGTTTLTGGITQKAAAITGSGATVTLTAAQSGSLVEFDRAAGIVYTLPAASVGLEYEFVIVTTITSNAAKVITPASVFLLGSINTIATDASNAWATWTADGSTIRSISMNGTTTGGYAGARFSIECVSSTQWVITGRTPATGTVATPFATS